MRLTRIAILALVASGARVAAAASPEGPVVIFLVDTLRQDRVSAYGAPRPTTPAADALARQGVLFENAYALSSWTRASVGTLFTSLLPAEAGAQDRNGRLLPGIETLPALFQAKGWRTAAFVGNANIDTSNGFSRGFDTFRAIDSANPEWAGHPVAREIVEPALRYIEGQTSPTFFLYVHVLDPHVVDPRLDHPLEPASRALFGPDRPRDERETLLLDYDRAVRQADDQFARLASALRKKGYWAGATVVYTSDHGEEILEHGKRLHGFSLYEEQVRIPLILKTPSLRRARRTEVVSLADVTPTLAAAFGLGTSARWIGSDLLKPLPDRPVYFTEDLDKCRLYALRQGDRKLIVRLNPEFSVALYDLGRDPGEHAGRELRCTVPPDPETTALVALARRWRERELPYFPGVHFEKRETEAMIVALTANLADTAEPFLTPEDHCRYAPLLRGTALSFVRSLAPGERFEMALSASDREELPPFRLIVTDAAGKPIPTSRTSSVFRVLKVTRPQANESDEQIKKLRSLGYFAGDAH